MTIVVLCSIDYSVVSVYYKFIINIKKLFKCKRTGLICVYILYIICNTTNTNNLSITKIGIPYICTLKHTF